MEENEWPVMKREKVGKNKRKDEISGMVRTGISKNKHFEGYFLGNRNV